MTLYICMLLSPIPTVFFFFFPILWSQMGLFSSSISVMFMVFIIIVVYYFLLTIFFFWWFDVFSYIVRNQLTGDIYQNYFISERRNCNSCIFQVSFSFPSFFHFRSAKHIGHANWFQIFRRRLSSMWSNLYIYLESISLLSNDSRTHFITH